MRQLGMPVSDDTILRHLKRSASRVDDDPPALIIGIDDWSWRKSWRYGTIIVDLERRKVMDILEDRSVASVAQWLKRHPSIEVVSRDRCGLYAQAAREGAPQASQVADRFHLIQNLRLAIEEQMSLSGRATGRALLPDGDIEIDHDDRALHEQAPETPWRNQLRRAHLQSRKEVFETVHALSKEGLTCSEIARRTGYGRRSIARWLTFETPPDRRRGDSRHLLYTSKPFSPSVGMTVTAVGGICLMTSSTVGIPAAFPILNVSWQPGAARRGRKRIRIRVMRRRLGLSSPTARMRMRLCVIRTLVI